MKDFLDKPIALTPYRQFLPFSKRLNLSNKGDHFEFSQTGSISCGLPIIRPNARFSVRALSRPEFENRLFQSISSTIRYGCLHGDPPIMWQRLKSRKLSKRYKLFWNIPIVS
jgi:hypothetical protein